MREGSFDLFQLLFLRKFYDKKTVFLMATSKPEKRDNAFEISIYVVGVRFSNTLWKTDSSQLIFSM